MHIDLSRKENITPLEYLANFLRKTYQEVGSDEDPLQEEDQSEEDNKVSFCKEFDFYITNESSSEENPLTNNLTLTALASMNNLSKIRKALVICALIDISCATSSQFQ
ncbi:18703_t:CDS:2 [Funneliformis geosporum]|uniref:13879_t:CDS:1 n=1 Tax=Funneliformis geosporum TaxID=1117311 RepID=A0A9W4WQJ0_9GLOM|nr:13879_t:CDS:2 [Funneliformis geosporum]CAI2182007.1 18703_t:CDS:2 [Funneliformis geosporum]